MTGPGGTFDRFVALVNKLELTADQKTQVRRDSQGGQHRRGGKGDDAAKIYPDASAKITALLTDAQKTKLTQPSRPSNYSSTLTGR